MGTPTITLNKVSEAIIKLQTDPRFIRFSPPLEVQIPGIVNGNWGYVIMADFDVSGGCRQASSPFSVKLTE